MAYVYIAGTIVMTAYGQLVLKWQVSKCGPLPVAFLGKLAFLLGQLGNPWVLSSFGAAFLGALCWMAALTKFELSHVYPFTSLSFVLVLILGCTLFRESITIYKVVGIALILAGVAVIGARS